MLSNFHVKQQPTSGSNGLGGGVHNVGTIWKPRADPDAQYLKVAYSGLSEHGWRNVASLINKTSAPTPVFIPRQSTSAIFVDTQVKWTSEGYDTSLKLGTRQGINSGWFASEDPEASSTTRDLQAFGTNLWTFETWIYIPAFQTDNDAAVAIMKHNNDVNDASSKGFKITITGSNFGGSAAERRTLYFTAGPPGTTALTSQNSINAGQWHHVAVTRTSTGSSNSFLKMYIDGQERTALRQGSCNRNWDYTGPVFCSSDSTHTTWDNVMIQDYRIYQGVAKYTGSTYTTPSSMFIKN